MIKRIVYTGEGGKVSVCLPADECIQWLSSGGYWKGRPRGFVSDQIERQIAAGHLPWAARRFVHALQDGGCTTAEALEIIRDRDCAHRGTGHELWDAGDLPDRWFRNAWRRSPNGGPIRIDLEAARAVQFGHIRRAIDKENHRRMSDMHLFDAPLETDLRKIRDDILAADTEWKLRAVWPKGLKVAPFAKARRSRPILSDAQPAGRSGDLLAHPCST